MLKVLSDCNIRYTLFDWLKYRALPSEPIKCKTNSNRDLVARVFPRWTQVTCVNFEFSLVPSDITLSSSWPFVITLVFPFRRAIENCSGEILSPGCRNY